MDSETRAPRPDLKQSRLTFQTRLSKYDDPNELIAEVKGERFREYRRRFYASSRGELSLDYPIDLSIEAVDSCNYACPYCPRAVDRGSSARIDKDAFQRLIDEFAEKTEGLAAVGFDRGEPLLDRHLEDKVCYINDRGIVDIILTTNGVFLTPQRSRTLIEAGLTKLHVSIDAATQETYTKCRGGNLAQVEWYVKEFLRLRAELGRKIPILRVSFVVNPLNDHEQGLFAQKWGDLADYVEFQDCVDHSNLDALVDFETEPFYCHYPFQSTAITAKGEILPCCSFYAKHFVFGNILKGDSIGDIFRGQRTEALRQSFLHKRNYNIVCKNCCKQPPSASPADVILVQPKDVHP